MNKKYKRKLKKGEQEFYNKGEIRKHTKDVKGGPKIIICNSGDVWSGQSHA